MTFTLQILAREITAAIAACAQIVDSHSQIPILRCTRIAVADGMASFTATNTDQTVVAKAACEGAGIICVDTAALSAKVQTLKPDSIVSFVGDGKSVTITQGRTKWVAPLLMPEDFPFEQVTAEIDGTDVAVGADFIEAVKLCIPAVEAGDTRYYLVGAHLDGNCVVATNGKQLRIVEHGATIAHRITVPLRAASKLGGMFPDGAVVRTSEAAVSFTSPTLSLRTKVCEGMYPDYRRVVPDNHPGLVMVDPVDLLSAIQRASAINASEGGKADGRFINMQMRIGESEIEIISRNGDGEEASDFAAAERVSGSDISIGFNGKWLMQCVESLDCDTVEILYGGQGDPVILRPKASERENVRVVMPRWFT